EDLGLRIRHGRGAHRHPEIRGGRDPVVLRGRREVFGAVRVRILPTWLREFVKVAADDRQLAEDLTSAGIAVESVQEEDGATIYEMDLTTNRVDAMNHYGVSREASAIYDVDLKPVEPKLPKPKVRRTAPPNISGPIGMTSLTEQMEAAAATLDTDAFPIVIEDAQGCARYTARIVRNVKIGQSPQPIAARLE